MVMVYRKHLIGIMIPRTLSLPGVLGSIEVGTTAMVLVRAPSTSTTAAAMTSTSAASVWLFPSLERSDLL